MRRTGVPNVVTGDGVHHALSRVEFHDKSIAEEFLQKALDTAPQLLPVEDLDPSYSPLVSLGREIDNIDNLFVSPNGRITLVETKLWRNPEATREVVAQLLDYAARLNSWSYSELEQAVRKALPPAPLGEQSLYEYVAAKCPGAVLPEEQFIDEVQKGLRAGRFLLLIVGDGIRENVETMLGLLHQRPQMLFTFGLVEMQVYESPLFSGHLLLPLVVAQTTEIQRAVVRVVTTGEAKVEVAIDDSTEHKQSSVRRTLNEDLFFAELPDDSTSSMCRDLLDAAVELGALLGWRSSGVSVQLPDPGGSGRPITLYVLSTSGELYTGWISDQLRSVGLDGEIGLEYVRSLAALFKGVGVSARKPDNIARSIRAAELKPRVDDVKALVAETVARIEDAAHASLDSA